MRTLAIACVLTLAASTASAQYQDGYYVPAPPPTYDPDLLPEIVPVMMGTGLLVLGGFATATMLAAIAFGGFDMASEEAISGLTTGLAFSLLAMLGGGWMIVGGITGDVPIRSANPAWQWIGAIASLAGAVAWCSSLTAYLVDDDFGNDSLGLILGGIGSYVLSLVFLIDLQGNRPQFAVTPLFLEDGGGVAAMGAF